MFDFTKNLMIHPQRKISYCYVQIFFKGDHILLKSLMFALEQQQML